MSKYLVCNTYGKRDRDFYEFKNFLVEIEMVDNSDGKYPPMVAKSRDYKCDDLKEIKEMTMRLKDMVKDRLEFLAMFKIKRVVAYNIKNRIYRKFSNKLLDNAEHDLRNTDTIYLLPVSYFFDTTNNLIFDAPTDEDAIEELRFISKSLIANTIDFKVDDYDDEYFISRWFCRSKGFSASNFFYNLEILDRGDIINLTPAMKKIEDRNLAEYFNLDPLYHMLDYEDDQSIKNFPVEKYFNYPEHLSTLTSSWSLTGITLTDPFSKALVGYILKFAQDKNIDILKKFFDFELVTGKSGFIDDQSIFCECRNQFALPLVSLEDYFRINSYNLPSFDSMPTKDLDDFINNRRWQILNENIDIFYTGISEFIPDNMKIYQIGKEKIINIKEDSEKLKKLEKIRRKMEIKRKKW